MKRLGIGWDVGGWMGKKNAFAFSTFDTEKQEFKFLTDPFHTLVPSTGFFDIQEVAAERGIHLEEYDKVVIGIDAPLGFPRMYKEMVNGNISALSKPEKEILSPFAYRDTERFIHHTFRKKPLSAPFDKIGNNLTLALYHAHFWNEKYGFHIHPQEAGEDDQRIMIEVYPALVKLDTMYRHVWQFLDAYKSKFNDDEYDASICSFIATIHASGPHFLQGLHTPAPPNDPVYREEGWIYYIQGNKDPSAQ